MSKRFAFIIIVATAGFVPVSCGPSDFKNCSDPQNAQSAACKTSASQNASAPDGTTTAPTGQAQATVSTGSTAPVTSPSPESAAAPSAAPQQISGSSTTSTSGDPTGWTFDDSVKNFAPAIANTPAGQHMATLAEITSAYSAGLLKSYATNHLGNVCTWTSTQNPNPETSSTEHFDFMIALGTQESSIDEEACRTIYVKN